MKKTAVEKLPPIPCGSVPKVLFIGNGINRLFNYESWESTIKTLSNEHGIEYNSDIFGSIPYTMQVVAATGDTVDTSMVSLCRKLRNAPMTDEHKAFARKISELPFTQILSANYTYEIERSVKEGQTFKSCYTVSKIDKTNDMMLHRYTPLKCGGEDKYIWHIHGQVSTPVSVIMGHYYYGKLIAQIQNYLPALMKRYKGCQAHGVNFTPSSWVDYFLIGDVYMLGFGMDLSEIDMWWLACCKKRNFPDSHIFFYEPVKDIKDEKRLLMQTYGIEIPEINMSGNDYMKFYLDAMEMIKENITLKKHFQ